MLRQPAPYEPAPQHICLLRPDHLGDVLFMRPALAHLRSLLPSWHISLAIGPWSREIVDADKNVDEILEFSFPGFDRTESTAPWYPYQELLTAAAQLRERRPAAVVLMRNDHWWGALMAKQAGVPMIVGADHPQTRDLLTHSVKVKSDHWVAKNIDLVDHTAGALCDGTLGHTATYQTDPLIWHVTDTDRAAASNLLESVGVTEPFVVLHPGSGAPVKLWPADRWAKVCESLAARHVDLVVTGAAAEQPYLERITYKTSVAPKSLVGRTSIRELAAVFERSSLVAGVDSGPLHLAVAVGRPTLHIYGPSDVAAYGPWGNPELHRVIRAGITCSGCGNLSLSRPEGAGCMVAVREDDVLASIRDLLAL